MANEEPKRSKKTQLVVVSLLVVCAAGGAAWWFLLRPTAAAAESASETTPSTHSKIQATFHLESFVVNLADPASNRYLRAGIDLGLTKPVEENGPGESGVNFTGPIRDTIGEVLSSQNSDELLSAEGRAKLKEDLLTALQARVPELHVAEIYFTEFLVQR
jgi:flagellar FliL protein